MMATWSRSVTRCPAKTVPKPPLPRRGPSWYSASNASRSLPPGSGVGVMGATGSPCRGLVNMEEELRRLSPLSPQGVDARGSESGEPGLGGARMEGKETGGPEGPAKSAMLRFAARASPDATETGHAPPERVARGDGPSHLSLINPDSAPAVPQPIGTSSYLHTTLNVSSTPLCKYMPVSSVGRGLHAHEGDACREETGFRNPFRSNRVCFGCAALFLCLYVQI